MGRAAQGGAGGGSPSLSFALIQAAPQVEAGYSLTALVKNVNKSGQYGIPVPHECPNRAACIGGLLAECASGYDGILCAGCAEGYRPWFSSCFECPSMTESIIAASAVGILLVIGCWYLARMNHRISIRVGSGQPRRKMEQLMVKIRIFISFVQVIGTTVSSFQSVSWPSMFTSGSGGGQVIGVNPVAVLGFECVLSDFEATDPANMMLIGIALPVVSTVLLVIVYKVARWCGRNPTLGSYLRNGLFFWLLLYPGIVKLVCQMIQSCVKLCFYEGQVDCPTFNRNDHTTPCTTAWYGAARSVGFVLFFLVVLGLPLFVGLRLRKRKRELRTLMSAPQVKHQLSPEIHAMSMVAEGYTPESFYWETVELLRKMSLTGIVLFINPESAGQILFGVCVCFFFVWLLERREPYAEGVDHNLAQMSLVVIAATMLCGLALLTLDLQSEGNERSEESIDRDRNVIGIFLLTLMVIFIAYFIYSMLRVLNDMFVPDKLASGVKGVYATLKGKGQRHHAARRMSEIPDLDNIFVSAMQSGAQQGSAFGFAADVEEQQMRDRLRRLQVRHPPRRSLRRLLPRTHAPAAQAKLDRLHVLLEEDAAATQELPATLAQASRCLTTQREESERELARCRARSAASFEALVRARVTLDRHDPRLRDDALHERSDAEQGLPSPRTVQLREEAASAADVDQLAFAELLSAEGRDCRIRAAQKLVINLRAAMVAGERRSDLRPSVRRGSIIATPDGRTDAGALRSQLEVLQDEYAELKRTARTRIFPHRLAVRVVLSVAEGASPRRMVLMNEQTIETYRHIALELRVRSATVRARDVRENEGDAAHAFKGWAAATRASLGALAKEMLETSDAEVRRTDAINALVVELRYAREFAEAEGFVAPRDDEELDFLHDHDRQYIGHLCSKLELEKSRFAEGLVDSSLLQSPEQWVPALITCNQLSAVCISPTLVQSALRPTFSIPSPGYLPGKCGPARFGKLPPLVAFAAIQRRLAELFNPGILGRRTFLQGLAEYYERDLAAAHRLEFGAMTQLDEARLLGRRKWKHQNDQLVYLSRKRYVLGGYVVAQSLVERTVRAEQQELALRTEADRIAGSTPHEPAEAAEGLGEICEFQRLRLERAFNLLGFAHDQLVIASIYFSPFTSGASVDAGRSAEMLGAAQAACVSSVDAILEAITFHLEGLAVPLLELGKHSPVARLWQLASVTLHHVHDRVHIKTLACTTDVCMLECKAVQGWLVPFCSRAVEVVCDGALARLNIMTASVDKRGQRLAQAHPRQGGWRGCRIPWRVAGLGAGACLRGVGRPGADAGRLAGRV